MPTPESESFLRKKPTVAPSYDGIDLSNAEQVTNVRDAIIREQWVQVMMARLVREEMGKCYTREGVNHLEKCGKYRGMTRPRDMNLVWWGSKGALIFVVERYLQLLKSAKVHGYKGYEQNYAQDVNDKNYIQTNYPTARDAMGMKGSDFRPGNTIGKNDERF